MKILLVSPEARVWTSRTHIHNGLGYLAGALLHAGYEVDIYDGAVEDESLAARLERERTGGAPVDVVGISSPTPLIYEAWEYARVSKEQGAITILGGPHLTLLPDESMQKAQVDFVVRGEGEATLVEFLRALERQKKSETPDWQSIRGLSWKNADGKIFHNPDRPLNPK